jgi:hypothetical protein
MKIVDTNLNELSKNKHFNNNNCIKYIEMKNKRIFVILSILFMILLFSVQPISDTINDGKSGRIITIFLGIGLGLSVWLLIISSIREDKERKEKLKRFSFTHGFSFKEKDDISFIKGSLFGKLFAMQSLFSKPKASNVIEFSSNKISWRIFDYAYNAGETQIKGTAAHCQLEGNMISFVLRRENILDKMGEKLGHKDINFDKNPIFSKKYFLKSPDARIRQLFCPELIRFFEQMQEPCIIEANDQEIIIFNFAFEEKKILLDSDLRIEPEKMIDFISICEKIVSQIRDSSKKLK